MGSYTFRWEHPASEVFVAGSFTNWQPTVRLDQAGTAHEKTVDIPTTTDKILYKFVADGEWKHDHTGKIETDHEGNVNNVLYPSDIKPHGVIQSVISSVAPGASTTAMAGTQPTTTTPGLENTPGAFPETPAAGLEEKKEEQTFSVTPIPASEGAGNPIKLAPGEPVPHPSTINANTLTSSVHDDPSLKSQETEQTFGVAPIPASGGIGNPVHLQPGEKVPEPSTLTGNTLASHVKLDQASYEKSDAGAPQLPPVLTPQGEKEARGEAAIFAGVGPQTTNLIPESSIGMGSNAPAPLEGSAISSVGVTSTTNQLAGQVPREPRGIPEVVSESQKEAHAAPEASANPTAVVEKREVENELKSKVPQEKATNDWTAGDVAGAVAGGIAGAGAAVAAGAYALASKAQESQIGQQVGQQIGQIGSQSATQPSSQSGVPEVVADSQKEAHAAPEASANPIAVEEKKEVESELKSKVPEEKPTSDNTVLGAVTGGIAGAGAAAAGAALALNARAKESTGTDAISMLPESVQSTIHNNAKSSDLTPQNATHNSAVPTQVTESQKEAHVAPEASANPEAVAEKSAAEKELLNKVPHTDATGQPAPVATAATSATAPAASTTGPGSAQRDPMHLTSNTGVGATSAALTASKHSASGAPQLADPVGGIAPINMDKELNAPASSQAQTPATRANELSVQGGNDSRDVSPMSKPTTATQTQPTATTGVDSTTVPSQSKPVGTPRTGASNSTPTKRNSIMDRFKGTPESSKDSTKTPDSEGKKKGFFGKLKDKLKH